MSEHPRTVAVETWIQWDGMPVRLPRGQVIDVTPGGALEQAIGRDRLVSLRGRPLPPPAAQGGGGGYAGPAAEVTPASPPKSRATAKKPADDGDGDP